MDKELVEKACSNTGRSLSKRAKAVLADKAQELLATVHPNNVVEYLEACISLWGDEGLQKTAPDYQYAVELFYCVY